MKKQTPINHSKSICNGLGSHRRIGGSSHGLLNKLLDEIKAKPVTKIKQ
ncbi:MAG TPA: hypothetical protein VD815_09790 [Candidatus Saccharimonadales bacterium]|nr:hypothetical protein [Candidatus Saccharimonadales bacterium]